MEIDEHLKDIFAFISALFSRFQKLVIASELIQPFILHSSLKNDNTHTHIPQIRFVIFIRLLNEPNILWSFSFQTLLEQVASAGDRERKGKKYWRKRKRRERETFFTPNVKFSVRSRLHKCWSQVQVQGLCYHVTESIRKIMSQECFKIFGSRNLYSSVIS